MSASRIAVVMTVFNRREVTLDCLDRLRQQRVDEGAIAVFVVDDASPDGTADAIASQHPEVHLIRGAGDLYWNGGMRAAFGAALADDFDYYLWMNDDTHLDDGAVSWLLETAQTLEQRDGVPAIVVGSTRHPDDGSLTYGGVRRSSRSRPLHFERIQPTDEPVRAETMNGNCVLLPRPVARSLGNIDPAFRQKMGDFDYGLRARAKGFPVWVAAGTIGTCATHPPRRTSDKPLLGEIRRLGSVKELPPGPWMAFTRRHGGPLWPLYFVSPYVRRSLRLVTERLASSVHANSGVSRDA